MKKLLILAIFSVLAIQVFGQRTLNPRNEDKPSFGQRVFFGGGLGFGAGNNTTSIQVNPIVGYMITPQLSAGVGVDYQYIKYKDRFNGQDFDDNLWGFQVFTRYNIKMFFVQAEYNRINYTEFFRDGSEQRASGDRLLLGGGISQPLGRRGAINLAAMYDVLYENSGPFGSPWVFRILFSY